MKRRNGNVFFYLVTIISIVVYSCAPQTRMPGYDAWVPLLNGNVLHDLHITHIINGDTVLQYSKTTMGGGLVQENEKELWQTVNVGIRCLAERRAAYRISKHLFEEVALTAVAHVIQPVAMSKEFTSGVLP